MTGVSRAQPPPASPGPRAAGVRAEIGFALALLPILSGVLSISAERALLERAGGRLAFLLAGGGWMLAATLARRVRDSWAVLVVVLSGAVALRLCALAGEPALSDDVHRYVWEGGLLAEGVDPYALAPDAGELAPFRARWAPVWERVNHREVPAAYPPLTELASAAAVTLAGGPEHVRGAVLAVRILSACCDLLVCLPLLALLRARARPIAALAIWAWSPLVALEFAGSGHGDALAILCLVGALASFERASGELVRSRREAREGLGIALLAAGFLAKLLPGALIPCALRASGRPLRGLLVALLAASLVLAGFALLTGALPGVGGLGEYSFRWESFNLVSRWIERPLERFLERDEGWKDPRRVARAIVLLLWLGLGALAWVRRLDLVTSAAILVGGFLVLTPVLHPWYLAWMVPFLCLRPSRAWTFLLAASPLLYWPLAGYRETQVWKEPPWLWPVLALPFFLLLALELAGRPLRARA